VFGNRVRRFPEAHFWGVSPWLSVGTP
jgi:hypothetical protein